MDQSETGATGGTVTTPSSMGNSPGNTQSDAGASTSEDEMDWSANLEGLNKLFKEDAQNPSLQLGTSSAAIPATSRITLEVPTCVTGVTDSIKSGITLEVPSHAKSATIAITDDKLPGTLRPPEGQSAGERALAYIQRAARTEAIANIKSHMGGGGQ